MEKNIFGIMASIIYVGIVIISSKMFELGNKEACRKYMHILLSNWWIIAMLFLNNPIVACIFPMLFIIINYLSYKYNIIKTMERGGDKKEGLGTVYYAISLTIISYLSFGPLNNKVLGLCAIMIMGYGDGMAAVIGQSYKSKEFKIGDSKKTLIGSLTMLIISFFIISGYFVYANIAFGFLKSLFISVILTILEAVSIKGTDNLTVPLFTMLLLYLI